MNKRGVAVLVYFMLGVVFFLVGLGLSQPLNEIIGGDDVMGSNGLDCANESISNQDKANCKGVEIIHPVYIAVILGLGAMLITRIII